MSDQRKRVAWMSVLIVFALDALGPGPWKYWDNRTTPDGSEHLGWGPFEPIIWTVDALPDWAYDAYVEYLEWWRDLGQKHNPRL